ncbi:MAG: tRNA glutamyl-Q(34) synthetase GluQRS [Candidatus Accumulibacter sp.]|jgi:glutamyl-Q tRNA(Asp) synthetase|nr:tRNA glutamyl-Q(34) synthetase GluQRS [Accumulibacter sp.]
MIEAIRPAGDNRDAIESRVLPVRPIESLRVVTAVAPYRGRFAPSPTGPLHFGSLVAAMGSYLDARTHGGTWLLRIEDIDRPRIVPGAAQHILQTLENLGFEWDGSVHYQSERIDLYREALTKLQHGRYVFPCACSRREIEARVSKRSIDGAPLYPGTCRNCLPDGAVARSWRMKAPDREFSFVDRVQGEIRQNLAHEVGDFVLFRADGECAYQLAVVVDDALQGVNAVVRGADLIDSTVRQIHLQKSLGLPTPSYAHLPVATDSAGQKLSKQTRARPIDSSRGTSILVDALRFLGQSIPEGLHRAPLSEFWSQAIAGWSICRVPGERAIFIAA